METLFFKTFVWLCFAGLVIYTYLYGKNEEKMDAKVFLIRKIWYLVYLFGALVYWTIHPASIFMNFKNYAITALIFAAIDGFIFLNMYFRKAGKYELERFTKTVSANESLIQDNLLMAKNMLDILNDEGIVGYYGSKEGYLLGLKEVLASYAEKADMSVNILPFTTPPEKDQALYSFANPGSARAKLDRLETVYHIDENYALHPIYLFHDALYLLKISGSRAITEMDCILFVIMAHVYDFAAPPDDMD